MPDHPAIAALPPEERARWEAAKRIFCTPRVKPDKDDGELVADANRRIAILQEWSHIFTALGMDVPRVVAELEALRNNFARAATEADVAAEAALQATADLADAEHEMFKATEPIVRAAYEERPFDPQVQEWKEFLDEWRKQMPKE